MNANPTLTDRQRTLRHHKINKFDGMEIFIKLKAVFLGVLRHNSTNAGRRRKKRGGGVFAQVNGQKKKTLHGSGLHSSLMAI